MPTCVLNERLEKELLSSEEKGICFLDPPLPDLPLRQCSDQWIQSWTHRSRIWIAVVERGIFEQPSHPLATTPVIKSTKVCIAPPLRMRNLFSPLRESYHFLWLSLMVIWVTNGSRTAGVKRRIPVAIAASYGYRMAASISGISSYWRHYLSIHEKMGVHTKTSPITTEALRIPVNSFAIVNVFKVFWPVLREPSSQYKDLPRKGQVPSSAFFSSTSLSKQNKIFWSILCCRSGILGLKQILKVMTEIVLCD